MRRLLALFSLVGALFLASNPVLAHPAPFSYLDLRVNAGGVSGALVVHDFDIVRELKLPGPDLLLDPEAAARHREALVQILSPRISFTLDRREAPVAWGSLEALPERQSLRLTFTLPGTRPARIHVKALLFPYDPVHQTFVNVYEDDALTHQAILDMRRQNALFYAGTTKGRMAVVRTFIISGIEHILIGPDHVLFLVGLLLLRGSLSRLVLIVSAFTFGHSVTLSLAVLNLVSPPTRLIEPLIALTIIVVGADNLLVLRVREEPNHRETDIRAWLAAGFGLIHGFGFASVLREFGLPQAALGWSLLAFNVGVEIGQLAIVLVVATVLEGLARRSARAGSRAARAGSIGVILAGTYWFIQRTFLPGG
jgi:hydrogenase/urease accessory protein HupE